MSTGHKTVYDAIQLLEKKDEMQTDISRNSNIFVSHLTPGQYAVVAKLVGEKCKIHCVIEGVETLALWDTGAQVSILPKDWLKENCPINSVRDIEELLGTGVKLDLTAANGTSIPYEGWTPVSFKLATAQDTTQQIEVPSLVAREGVECPIIGYSVIESIVKEATQR